MAAPSATTLTTAHVAPSAALAATAVATTSYTTASYAHPKP